MPTNNVRDLGTLFCQHHMSRAAKTWAEGKSLSSSSWRSCPNASWMLEFAIKAGVDRKVVGLATCACARTALPFADDPVVERCVETTEKFLNGQATREELGIVDHTIWSVIAIAWDASHNFTENIAKNTARSAAFSAESILNAALGAKEERSVELAALDAAWSSDRAAKCIAQSVFFLGVPGSAARGIVYENHQKKMARIVRRFVPWNMIEEKIRQ